MTSGDTPICVAEALHSCRCCLRRAPDWDLTTPYVHLGTTVTTEIYSDMLKECFKIQVTLYNDGVCGICDVCVSRLRVANDFKRQVERSQVELQARLRGELQAGVEDCLKLDVREDKWMREDSVLSETAVSSGVSDDDYTSQPSYRSDSRGAGCRDHAYAKTERLPAAVPPYGEDEDGADLESAGAVSARAREQLAMACSVRLERLRGDEAPHASQTCLATSRRGPRLATRMKDTPDDTAGLRAEEQAYTCDTCGEHFTDESRLIKHIKEYMSLKRDGRNKTYVLINKCVLKKQKVIQTKGPLRRGPRLVSRMSRAGPRVGRTGRLRRAPNVNGRQAQDVKGRQNGNVKKFETEGRPKTISPHPDLGLGPALRMSDMPDDTATQRTSKSNLNEHIKNTTQQHKQSPYEFNSALAVRSSFGNHTRKLHSCNTCEKQFKYVYYLNRHILTHTGQKPFMCDACGKTFADNSTLRRHQQIHAGLQPYTCDICSKKIRHKGDLIRHIRIHMGHRPYTCDVCSKPFADSQTLRRHQQIHTGLKPYTCDICSKKFRLKGVLVGHIRIHMRHTAGLCAKEQVHTCDTCGAHFTNKSRLIKHRQAHMGLKRDVCNTTYVLVNKSVLKQQNIIQTKGPSRRGPRLASRMTDVSDDTAGLRAEEQSYTCDTCGEHFTDKSSLIEHRRVHTGLNRDFCNKTYVLINKSVLHTGLKRDVCNKTYVLQNKSVLKQQNIIQTKGPSRRGPGLASRMTDTPNDTDGLRAEEQSYTCDTCGEHFTDMSRLIKHKHDVCNKTYVLVNKCVLKQQKNFQTKGPSRRAPRLASRISDMPDDTAAQYTPSSNLNEDIKNTTQQQHKPSPYEFNSALAVRRSFRNHPRKLYSCDICEKQFKYPSDLNRHIRKHTGQKPFMCDVCGKTYADISTLRRHREIHAGLKPYTCDICSKTFRCKGFLVGHIRRHMGHRPYTCDVCSKTFPSNTDLWRHQGIHRKPYVCEICGKQFTRKSRLDIHFLTH